LFQACQTAFAIPVDLAGGDEFGGERIPLIYAGDDVVDSDGVFIRRLPRQTGA